MSSPDTPRRAGRREWIGLAVIALPCLLYSMDLTVLNLAVPALSADLQPSSAQLLWIVDIYGFLVAGSLITMGTLGDRIGRRRLLLIGAAAFGAASVLAAFSTSAEMLIAARALLGVAGATLAPSTLSLIRNMFHDPRSGPSRSACGSRASRSAAPIGPLARRRAARALLVGLGVPARRAGDGAAARASGRVLLPEFRDPDAGRLDLRQRRAVARPRCCAVIYGLKHIAQDGVGRPPALAILGRARARRRVRAPPAPARRPADRPAPVPRAGVQRRARDLHARLLRRLRRCCCSSPSTCSSCSASRRSRPALWTVPSARSASSPARC